MDLFRVITAAMAAAFVAMAVVQYNDPDPWVWIAIYGAAAAMCVATAIGRLRQPLPPLGLALVCGLWALILAVRIFGQPLPPGDLVADEEVRELGGLFIVLAAMLAVSTDARERRDATG